MQKARKRLGRGLSALIPDADMEFLSRVARGEIATPITKETEKPAKTNTAPTSAAPASRKKAADSTSPAKKPRKTRAALAGKASSPGSPQAAVQAEEETDKGLLESKGLVEFISITDIEPNPYQPRRSFNPEELEELSQSIIEHGVLQPILVRPTPAPAGQDSGSSHETRPYQLIAGERRWRASIAAQLDLIPVIIRQVSDQQTLEIAVIENLQRHDISAVDAALAYQRLVKEFSLSQEEVARRVGKSRSAVANTLRLLDLPGEVLKAIDENSLTEGHGRAILLAATDGARRAVFRQVIREKLSVRQTEELARSLIEKDEKTPVSQDTKGTHQPPEIRRIEETLQKKLGTRVRLRTRKVGGQLSVEYFSNEELERLLKLLMR